MSWAVALAAVMVAFPKDGQKLPYLQQCYLLGAVSPGETFVTVQDRDVDVYTNGAWATMIDLVEGTNTVQVGDTSVTYFVGRKPKAQSTPKPPKTYEKLEYAADIAKEPPTNRAPGEITVVIDAGHGGEDTGAISPHGWPEKDANLMVAKAVRRELAALGYKTRMTREDDRAVALYERPKTAHASNADAFISIHHNAPPLDRDPNQLRYTAVYAWNAIGERLAGAISRRMGEALADEIPNNGVMHANFAVTRNPEIPSCLVEVDFISSPEGEEACWNQSRQAQIAKAIAAGFADWTKGAEK